MRSRAVEICDVLSDDTMEMAFTQNEDMIQAFASHAPNEALANRIGLGCLHWGFKHLYLTVLGDSGKTPPLLLVIISDQKSRSLRIGRGFPDLLGNPHIAR